MLKLYKRGYQRLAMMLKREAKIATEGGFYVEEIIYDKNVVMICKVAV